MGSGRGGASSWKLLGGTGRAARLQAQAVFASSRDGGRRPAILAPIAADRTLFFRTPAAGGAPILLSIPGVALFQLVVVIERIFFPCSAGSGEAAIV